MCEDAVFTLFNVCNLYGTEDNRISGEGRYTPSTVEKRRGAPYGRPESAKTPQQGRPADRPVRQGRRGRGTCQISRVL